MTHASRRLHFFSRRVSITLCRRLDVVTTRSGMCRDLQFFHITINYAGEGMFRHLARPHATRHSRCGFSSNLTDVASKRNCHQKEVS